MTATEAERGRGLTGVGDYALHQLLAILRMDADISTRDLPRSWLDNQTNKIHGLDRSVKTSSDIGDRVLAHIQNDTKKRVNLCSAHRDLDGKVISGLTEVLVDECTIRCEPLRSPGVEINMVAPVRWWLDDMDEIAACYGHNYPGAYGKYIVPSGCEACICAAIGGRTRLVNALAAGVRARCETTYEYGEVSVTKITRQVPPLERVVRLWSGLWAEKELLDATVEVSEVADLVDRTRAEIRRRRVQQRVESEWLSEEEESVYGSDGSEEEVEEDVPPFRPLRKTDAEQSKRFGMVLVQKGTELEEEEEDEEACRDIPHVAPLRIRRDLRQTAPWSGASGQDGLVRRSSLDSSGGLQLRAETGVGMNRSMSLGTSVSMERLYLESSVSPPDRSSVQTCDTFTAALGPPEVLPDGMLAHSRKGTGQTVIGAFMGFFGRRREE